MVRYRESEARASCRLVAGWLAGAAEVGRAAATASQDRSPALVVAAVVATAAVAAAAARAVGRREGTVRVTITGIGTIPGTGCGTGKSHPCAIGKMATSAINADQTKRLQREADDNVRGVTCKDRLHKKEKSALR